MMGVGSKDLTVRHWFNAFGLCIFFVTFTTCRLHEYGCCVRLVTAVNSIDARI